MITKPVPDRKTNVTIFPGDLRRIPATDRANSEAVNGADTTHGQSTHKPSVETPDTTRISRTLINFWLDAALMGAFVTLSLVAVIVQFVFPSGVTAKGWILWGMNYGQWCSLQFALLSVLGFGIVIHVMLHWTWVCSVIAKKLLRHRELPDDGIRTVYGVGLLIVLLVTGAAIVRTAIVGTAMMTIRIPSQ